MYPMGPDLNGVLRRARDSIFEHCDKRNLMTDEDAELLRDIDVWLNHNIAAVLTSKT